MNIQIVISIKLSERVSHCPLSEADLFTDLPASIKCQKKKQ